MYEYEIKTFGPNKTLHFYKNSVEIYKSQDSFSTTEEQLLVEAYSSLEQEYPDIRANSKRKSITDTTSSQQTYNTTNKISEKVDGYEFIGYASNDSIFVEIKYLGETIVTNSYILNYASFINGVEYKGVTAAIKDVKFTVEKFGLFINGKSYPKINKQELLNKHVNTSKSSIKLQELSGSTFNSISDKEFKKQKEKLEDGLESLQSLGLPPIQLAPKIMWEKIIEPKILTKRQIIKKIIMINNQSLNVPMEEEDAQLIVYGKLYYKDGKLYDNDVKDSACLAQPGDPDYQRPIDENHPLWKEINKKIEDNKKAFKQLGIKLGEFTFLIPHTIQVITVSLTAMVSSLTIMPFGSGVPTAMTAVQNIITAIKQLQAKVSEFYPIIAVIETIALLLPKEAQGVISSILGIFKLIIGIITGLTSILSLIDIILRLLERLKRKMRSVKVKVVAKAQPSEIEIGKSTILSVEVNGGDYDYVYEWTDSGGNIISRDPNSDDDDGTREITPETPLIRNTTNKITQSYNVYTCKVTDQKGAGMSASSSVTVYRSNS